MIDYHDHPVYAESRGVDSLRYDLEDRIKSVADDCRSERRELRAEVLGGLTAQDQELEALRDRVSLLEDRVAALEQKLPTVYEVHDLAGRIDAMERGLNAAGGV